MYQILGYKISEGVYRPDENSNVSFPYKNYQFSFMTDENSKFTGYATAKDGMSLINIREKDFTKLTGLAKPDDLIGKKVSLYFGLSYGKAVLDKVVILEK